jgi:uncharacterized SAM-binding protein YcdF (DUF218 family)
MFFILSKTVSYLVMPVTLICIILLASALIKNSKWKRRLFWVGLGMLLLFSNEFVANEIMRAWEIKTIAYADLKPHDLGIVLTGSTIPFLEPNDRVYFQRGADRVTHTVQLYKMGLIKKVLISGGSGRILTEDEPEANKFKKAMIMMGVDSANIMIENETRNTYESAVAVKPMLDKLHYREENCLLITSAFHMRRSLACYRKAGVELKPFTTDFYAHPRTFTLDALIIPELEAIVLWQKLIKEWVGLATYKVLGYA